MGLLSWLFGDERQEAPDGRLMLADSRSFNFDVVGESYRQDVLDGICGGKCEEGHDIEVLAQLCFVDDNPYDKDAVGVFVDRQLVGYVPAKYAARFRSEILAINPRRQPVVCKGRITGGWKRGRGDEGHYGIKLSLTSPLQPAKG